MKKIVEKFVLHVSEHKPEYVFISSVLICVCVYALLGALIQNWAGY